MAEKLKLARELIPWSLVLKGAIFAAAWLLLPFVVFVAVAAWLFFRPPFQVVRFLPIFLFIVYLTTAFLPQPSELFFVSLLFLTALGIKNLVFVDRELAAEVFLVVSSLLLWRLLFSAHLWPGSSFFLVTLGLLLVLFLLTQFMFRFSRSGPLSPAVNSLLLLFCFLLFQLSWVLSFLPLSTMAQAVFVALFVALFLELISAFAFRGLSFFRVAILSSGFLGIMLVLLMLMPFSLGS